MTKAVIYNVILQLFKVCTLGLVRVLWVESIVCRFLIFVEIHGHSVPHDPALYVIIGAYTLIACVESIDAFPVLFDPIIGGRTTPHFGEELRYSFLLQEYVVFAILLFKSCDCFLVKLVLIFFVIIELAQVRKMVFLTVLWLMPPVITDVFHDLSFKTSILTRLRFFRIFLKCVILQPIWAWNERIKFASNFRNTKQIEMHPAVEKVVCLDPTVA